MEWDARLHIPRGSFFAQEAGTAGVPPEVSKMHKKRLETSHNIKQPTRKLDDMLHSKGLSCGKRITLCLPQQALHRHNSGHRILQHSESTTRPPYMLPTPSSINVEATACRSNAKWGLQFQTWDLSSNWPRRIFVKGTSPVGIKKLSSLATKWLVLKRSSSNFGSCPVPSNELRVTNSGTETSVYPCSVLPSRSSKNKDRCERGKRV